MSVAATRLSPRHRDCLRLVYQRRTTKEIARELGIAPGTAAAYCTEAIAILNADDRRHAAELFHALDTAPSEVRGASSGVGSEAVSGSSPAPTARPAHPLGPLAPANRDADNDASITARIAWIIALAIGLAIGFGSIVTSVRTISDVVRERHQAPR